MPSIADWELDNPAAEPDRNNQQHTSCKNSSFQDKNEYELADALDPQWQDALPHTIRTPDLGGK